MPAATPAIEPQAPAEMGEPSDRKRSAKPAALGRSVASMGTATAVDLFAQVFIPIALVRLLGDTEFGLYRTLWLIAGTTPGVLALGMPNSLYYFLPRSSRDRSSIFVLQASMHMFVAAAMAAGGTAVFLALQGADHPLGSQAIVFVGLWVFASLLDYLYIAQQAIPTQARINLSFTALRVVLVLAAAFTWGTWPPVLAAHVAVVMLKAIACAVALRRYTGAGVRPSRDALREQYGYSLPVGVSNALYMVRVRLDQWLVASLFTAAQFGLYSIAAVFSPLQTLIRVTVNQVIQPELSRLQSQQDMVGMRGLNQRTNLAVTLLLFPAIAFIAVWAEPILSVLFTDRYSGAAPFVRIYLLVMAIESLEIAIVLVAMGHGRFVMKVDAIVLPFAVASALLGARMLGIIGAASGALVGAIIAQVLLYRQFAKLSGIRVADAQEWSAIARVALASGVAALVSCVGWAVTLPGGPIGPLVIAGLAFVATYRAALWAFGLTTKVRQALGGRLSRLAGFGGADA